MSVEVSAVDLTWGIWWDINERTFREGYVLLIHGKVGERAWHFYVKIESDMRKAVVQPLMMTKPYDKYLVQLLTKSIVFKKSDDGRYLCHPIGITYIQDERVKYRRISDPREVPILLRGIVDIVDRYGNLVSSSGRIGNFICVGLDVNREPDDLAERMVKVFIIEKILPIS